MFESCRTFAKITPLLQNFLQELYSVWTNLVHNVFVTALNVSDTFPSFVFSLTKMSKESNSRFRTTRLRVGSENDKNDLMQKVEIK